MLINTVLLALLISTIALNVEFLTNFTRTNVLIDAPLDTETERITLVLNAPTVVNHVTIKEIALLVPPDTTISNWKKNVSSTVLKDTSTNVAIKSVKYVLMPVLSVLVPLPRIVSAVLLTTSKTIKFALSPLNVVSEPTPTLKQKNAPVVTYLTASAVKINLLALSVLQDMSSITIDV